MLLAKVTARVVATAKLPNLPGQPLLEVEPLEGFITEKTPSGRPARLIAIDSVSAGPGDLVLILQEGSGARQALGVEGTLPAQAVVVGIVDHVQN